MLAARACGIRRQLHADRRAAVGPRLDLELAAQRVRPLPDRLPGRPPALAGSVVADHELDAAIRELLDLHRHVRGWPAPNGGVERLADDLVEGRLRALGQLLGPRDVHLDLDLLLEPELRRERL